MKNYSIIGFIYLAVSALALLCVNCTTTSYRDVIPGILYLWLCYLIYIIGIKMRGRAVLSERLITVRNEKYLFKNRQIIVLLLACIGVIVVARFYTGQTPLSIITSLRNGTSLYNAYQTYFIQNVMGLSILAKAPFILINAFVQFALIYSFIYIFVVKEKVNINDYLFMGGLVVAKMYFGIARGTNFEMFEVAFLIIYCFMKKELSVSKSLWRWAFIILGVLGCCFLFMLVIRMRGMTNTMVWISDGICSDESKYLTSSYPALSKMIASLSAYFAFGIYFISYYFNSFVGWNPTNIIDSIIPGSYRVLGIQLPNTGETEFLRSVCWTPDTMLGIAIGGVLFIPLVCFLFGRINQGIYLVRKDFSKDIYLQIVEYYLTYQMFSFPIGNFIFISSATKITLFIVILIILLRGKICIYR